MFNKNDKVIVRSNEDEPYMVGTFVEYQLITKKNVPYPVINVDGKEYLVMGLQQLRKI